MPVLAAVLLGGSVVAPIAGSLIGRAVSEDDRKAQKKAQEDALQQILGVDIPDIGSQELDLEDYRSAGHLTPEQEAAVLQQASEMKGITVDPRLKEAQMTALSKLQELGQGGLDAGDKAALNSIRRDVAAEAQARQGAILQNMQARGMGGGGAELAAQLAASQAGADRASQESDRTAVMAQQRALEAIMNAGSLGGKMRGQEFDEQSAIASAQDAINKFNAAQRQGVSQRNVDRGNRAGEFNLTSDQAVMNANTGSHNSEQEYNKRLIHQDYLDRFNKGKAAAGAYEGAAEHAGERAQDTQQMWSGIGQSVGKGLGAGAGMAAGMPTGMSAPSPTDYDSGNAASEAYKARKYKNLYG